MAVGNDTWAAIKGRNALKIEWDDGAHASYDSAAHRSELEAAVLKTGGKEVRNEGDACAALAKAAKKVTVNVTLLGGGFGRKSKADYVVEAALVSQAMDGKPVKLTWTREDDLHHDYFHAVSAQHLEAGLDANGKVTASLHHTAEPSIISIFALDPKQLAGFELGLGLVGLPYAIANIRIENPAATAHARIGWLRSVNNIQHALASQSFIAEVAQSLGKDHRDYLLELLELLGNDRPINAARLRKVIERVTMEAKWGSTRPAIGRRDRRWASGRTTAS